MNPTGAYLAIFLGGKQSAKMGAWLALPEADRHKREQEGIAAWHAWAEKHKADIVTMGGPLGKTKKVSPAGIDDIATRSGRSRSCAQRLPNKQPKCSKTTRTSPSFPPTAWRLCRCAR
jgi:hypothetical protein